MRFLILLLLGLTPVASMTAEAAGLEQRAGWKIIDTRWPFSQLSERLDAAVKTNKMAVVTTASASVAAQGQGFTIPGNRIVGVYRNDFARRMLASSLAAGIEAPIRFYLVENADGTSTLAYKIPSAVFGPYSGSASSDLGKLASELDAIFAKIAADAVDAK